MSGIGQTIKNMPSSVKVTQVLFLISIVLFLIVSALVGAHAMRYVVYAVVFLGCAAATAALLQYKKRIWPLAIIDLALFVWVFVWHLGHFAG